MQVLGRDRSKLVLFFDNHQKTLAILRHEKPVASLIVFDIHLKERRGWTSGEVRTSGTYLDGSQHLVVEVVKHFAVSPPHRLSVAAPAIRNSPVLLCGDTG